MADHPEACTYIIINIQHYIAEYVIQNGSIFGLTVKSFLKYVLKMLGGSLVTTAWRVLRLRMEGTASRYGG
jgi:hypothetical protein